MKIDEMCVVSFLIGRMEFWVHFPVVRFDVPILLMTLLKIKFNTPNLADWDAWLKMKRKEVKQQRIREVYSY